MVENLEVGDMIRFETWYSESLGIVSRIKEDGSLIVSEMFKHRRLKINREAVIEIVRKKKQ